MNPSSAESTEQSASPKKDIQVESDTKRIPEIVNRMNDWQYLERTLHRLLCAWGRHQPRWDDKVALHRQVWDQAEVVRRLRERIGQFPGGKPNAPVSPRLQAVGEAALVAPSYEDAVDGMFGVILPALVKAYVAYVTAGNAIHDAPTIAMLHEINTIKEQHYFWYRDYRRRVPHRTDDAYAGKIRAAIEECGGFLKALPVDREDPARPCGMDTDFRPPMFSDRPDGWRAKHDITPFVQAEFPDNMETRRLFWAWGYMLEMNLPDDQLSWLYWGHFMPWEWHHDVSRHLWDESRHGHSGYSRLQDWGIGIGDVGFPPYDKDALAKVEAEKEPGADLSKIDMRVPGRPMSPKDIYDAVFHIGMIAENGHFVVKNESYDDFKEGEDLESAEMMLFDIIDETTHVQYAHRWLPVLAEHAGISNEGYRERAAKMRKEEQARADKFMEEARALCQPGNPDYEHYLSLLERIRESAPLKKVDVHKHRTPRPM